ncbi:hypothetical protein CAPTEDRAFT_48766, partial [Capitella teleta]
LFVAALEDGTVIASCGFTHQNNETCELTRVATDERYQRKGVGQALLTFALQQSVSLGYKTAVLSTNGVQTAAHRMYEAKCFK